MQWRVSEQWASAAGAEQDEGTTDELEYTGYSAAFAQLHNAAIPQPDPLPDIPDARQYLAASLARFSQVIAQPPVLRLSSLEQPCQWLHSACCTAPSTNACQLDKLHGCSGCHWPFNIDLIITHLGTAGNDMCHF